MILATTKKEKWKMKLMVYNEILDFFLTDKEKRKKKKKKKEIKYSKIF